METTLGLIFVAGFVYLLPTIIAKQNKHHNVVAICALNILLGWTLVGWVVALVWALTKPAELQRT